MDDREGFSLPLGPDARMSGDGLKENEQSEWEQPMEVRPIRTRRCSNEEMIAREMRGLRICIFLKAHGTETSAP